jgi:nicotinate-nucleotide adenylyltransferase
VQRVLLYGGSFDPIHHGHLISARAASEQLQNVPVVLIPAAHPPHKPSKSVASFAERLEMCRLAVAGDPLFSVSDWEGRQTGPNYSLNTVEHFRGLVGEEAWIGWLIGGDSLLELHTWHRVADLCRRCTIVTAARPGFSADMSRLAALVPAAELERVRGHMIRSPQIEISASQIRARRRAGCSIRFLTPEPVVEYVERRGLYAG